MTLNVTRESFELTDGTRASAVVVRCPRRVSLKEHADSSGGVVHAPSGLPRKFLDPYLNRVSVRPTVVITGDSARAISGVRIYKGADGEALTLLVEIRQAKATELGIFPWPTRAKELAPQEDHALRFVGGHEDKTIFLRTEPPRPGAEQESRETAPMGEGLLVVEVP